MATTIFKCIFHMSIGCHKPTISVVSWAKLAQPDLQQSLLSLATIAKLVDNQQTFSCTDCKVCRPHHHHFGNEDEWCVNLHHLLYLASASFSSLVFPLSLSFSTSLLISVPSLNHVGACSKILLETLMRSSYMFTL